MLIDAPAVVLDSMLVRELHIVDDAGQQVVAELTLFQIIQLSQHEAANLLQRLTGLGLTNQQERRIVLLGLQTRTSTLHTHLLIEVEVEEACLAIAQHIADNIERITSQLTGFRCQPSHPYLLGLFANDSGIGRGLQRLLLGEYGLRDISTGLPLSEILLDEGDGLVGIEVTSHTDGHIVGHIPLLEVVFDIGNRRILQVILRTDSGLRTIGMSRRQLLAQRTPYLVAIIGEVDVILLVNGLQLSVETTDNHILETVGLHLGPVLNLVRRDILRIARHIVGGKGIGALSTNGSHQLVVLVGDEVLGSYLRHTVNLMVGLLTLCRVGQLAISFVALLNLVEQRLLGSRIGSTELLGALEHQVLQIMGETRCLSRVVLRTRTHGDIRLNTGFLLVYREIHLQAVIERIDTCLRDIARYRLVMIVFSLCPQ